MSAQLVTKQILEGGELEFITAEEEDDFSEESGFWHLTNLEQEDKNEYPDAKANYETLNCKFCDFQTELKPFLLWHINSTHPKEAKSMAKEAKPLTNKAKFAPTEAELMKATAIRLANPDQHFADLPRFSAFSNPSPRYRCKSCSGCFQKVRELQQHRLKTHQNFYHSPLSAEKKQNF